MTGVPMKITTAIAFVVLVLSQTAMGRDKMFPKAKVSFEDFKTIVAEVEPHRARRLVDFDTFLTMSKKPGVIVLDTRSTFRYDRIHLKGAKHLSFTDFTQDNLAKVIPSFDTPLLIYCNNNFEGNEVDFASKIALPMTGKDNKVAAQFNAQEKPRMMALNIPTYINLYGYGYKNVYELNELVDVKDPRVVFEGSIVR
ncbi:MAG: rhodanese-like domain-containing protein [Elusimicrobia bacterium]|nr:rhodanese-like domain-containing protein [Elusimicrobiota bacterium]MBK9056695.1 rhodanese-like domain-containing protein [Elusimicrobiota bacterium]MBK9695023.1 rhodanese-like domain-containing protein [Elusimicrobiota bacterium]